jgi:hypothetical protein
MPVSRLSETMSVQCILSTAVTVAMLAAAVPAGAQSSTRGETYPITRAKGPIVIDGNLSDEGWRDALRIERWYEINPGDNTEPKLKNVGYLTYDDKYFYAGFEFEDPDPKKIVSPYGDHDYIQGNADFGGMFLDTRNEGHTAYEFQVTAHNVQFDAVMDDNGGGENGSPDFFWESATRIHDHGWTLEIKIPFSSLRYRKVDPQDWGIMLWRNYARDYRYQFVSVKQPRGSQCFVCRENTLTGLSRLPTGGHLVVAPYVAANQTARQPGTLGTPLVNDPFAHKIGADVKYTPNADNTLDATIRPDFSQIESDTAQISTNQRFALFFPEKRPFFLEGVELFSTPIQAVYTRTITAPDWGARATGKLGGVNYTALVADDQGGGSVVIPGPASSSFQNQDFTSTVFIARARKDFKGLSFISALVTDRESGSSGHNRVVGPDFQTRFHGSETISGQFLTSDTNGVRSGAGQLAWSHNTAHFDFASNYKDFGTGFRADNGFVPQVGYREGYAETGWTFRPKGFLSRLRTFVAVDSQTERDNGATILNSVAPGAGMDTRLSGFMQFRYEHSNVRAGQTVFPRNQFAWYVRFSPSRTFQSVSIDGSLGTEVDFENIRPGRGGAVNVDATLIPTNHLVFDLISNTAFLHVDNAAGISQPLYTSRVQRVRSNYTFTSRSFIRVIGQYVSTDRDPALFLAPQSAHDGFFSGSVLFAYKINWQSVMFFGYGDDRTLDEQRRLQKFDRSLFLKVSYAFQR